jgi:hypothetical protein
VDPVSPRGPAAPCRPAGPRLFQDTAVLPGGHLPLFGMKTSPVCFSMQPLITPVPDDPAADTAPAPARAKHAATVPAKITRTGRRVYALRNRLIMTPPRKPRVGVSVYRTTPKVNRPTNIECVRVGRSRTFALKIGMSGVSPLGHAQSRRRAARSVAVGPGSGVPERPCVDSRQGCAGSAGAHQVVGLDLVADSDSKPPMEH